VLFLAFVRYQQNYHQKTFNRGFAFVQEGLTVHSLTKNPLIYSVSYFTLDGELEALFGGQSPSGDGNG